MLPITDYVVTDHTLRITDQGLRITDHASRNMSHMKQKTVSVVGLGYVGLPKLFCKQKPLLKNAYATIF